ncbi:MAG: imidazole glycerol phosphate synthase subunit HisH [Nitrospirae bacterium]|nr:imidazole glycerol phosphate synthase subunit HisH [Nitrospirota bacterium]
MIVVIDYGMGNLGSILNMLRKIGADAIISSKPEDLNNADKLILPGVGAFDNGMRNLEERGLIPILREQVLDKGKPVLGICLGMQLFTKNSEEGNLKGLGWINADTVRFKFDATQADLKIPHMGWNMIAVKKESLLFQEMYSEPSFYFVHSYHLVCNQKEDILATTEYGYEFVSIVNKNNIFGMQFHPEKSHRFGMRLLDNWVKTHNL